MSCKAPSKYKALCMLLFIQSLRCSTCIKIHIKQCRLIIASFFEIVQVIYIHSNEIHKVVALIKCLLVLRCQLYMFRTVTVHPQELLFRCCMCRLWYVVRTALSDTSRWYNVWARTSSSNVVPAGRIRTYHSLHIQHLKRSSWGWTVTVRNMYSWHLSTNKHLISATTLCISLECICIAKNDTRIFQCQVRSGKSTWELLF